MLLKRSGIGDGLADGLVTELGRLEQAELLRSEGRIHSRKRFKYSGKHPLLEARELSLLFVDESGKSGHEPAHHVAPKVFALGAVAIGETELAWYVEQANILKTKHFGRTSVTFHEPDMRQHKGPFHFRGDLKRQQGFDADMSQLLLATPVTVFGVAVRKDVYEKEFLEAGMDPYLPTDAYALAIGMLVERYLDFLATSSVPRMGRVTFESQGPKEDAEHQLEYARLVLEGTQWVPESAFRNWLEPGLRFTPKHGSDAMELADLFSREVYEWVRGNCDVNPPRWEEFNSKIYCRGDGKMGKFGLKVFPDSDLRDKVLAHRIQCGAKEGAEN